MKKSLCLFILFTLLSLSLKAQQKLNLKASTISFSEIFDEIEKQTNYRIYNEIEDLEEVLISVDSKNEDVIPFLTTLIEDRRYTITVFNRFIFITYQSVFITSLPEGYFDKNKKDEAEDYEQSSISLLFRRDQKATSENKVYEVGDPNDISTSSRVTLTGSVLDFKTGEPIPGVTVFIENPMIGTITDGFGYYSIQLPPGRHDLNIRGMGLKDTKRQMMLYGTGKLDIELEEQVYSLKEVTISSEKIENVRSTTMGMERLKMKEIKNIPTAFGEIDVIRVVMSLPGVKSAGETASGLNVRGGASDQNLIQFNDGIIYNPTHLFGIFSAFNPDIVRDMELYKSSIPAKYGGRISSVLDITTREGNRKKITGAASIGLLTSRLTVEGPIFSENTSFIVGGRTTYSDWILKNLPEDSGYKDGNAGFYDLNAYINHKFNEYDNLYVSGYFSRDRFRFDSGERYAYQNASTSIKWRHIFNPKFTSTFVTGYDHYDHNTVNDDHEPTAYDLSFGIDQFYGKSDFIWYLDDKHTLDFGVSTLHYNLNPGKYLPYGDKSIIASDIMQREKALESAIYIGDQWDVTQEFSINAGIRYSIFNVLAPRTYYKYDENYLPTLSGITDTVNVSNGSFKTYHGPEFRISARYEFMDGFSVKAGFNSMRQYIHKLSNTTIMSPTDTWKLSDVNIKPQTGSQVAVGLYKNLFDNVIEASIEGYYKKMNNYLDYRSNAQLVMNHHIETDVINTEGRAYGVEVMLKKTLGKLNGWLSYTYSKTELRQNDPGILKPVNNGNWYPSDHDKPHEVKMVGNYKFTHRFSLSVNMDYSTGRPITLPVSKYHYANGEFVLYSDRNQYRIPDFFRMDAAFNIEPSHHLTLLTHSTISIGVYNLTGRNNAYSVYYIAEEGQVKGYKLAIFGVPVPYISYNIKF